MKRMIVGLAALLIGVAVAPRGSAGDVPAGSALKIGMLDGMFRDVSPAMVQAMSVPFRSLFERQTGYTGDVEIVRDADTLAAKMKDKQLHLGVFHGYEFAQVRTKHPDLRPVVVTMPHARTCQAVVVVSKESKAAKLTDLADQPLALPRGLKSHCLAYLEKARQGLPAGTAKPLSLPLKTPEEVLNSVADGSCPAALVDIGTYNGYVSLQPGAAACVRVLCTSEVFPVSVIAARQGALSDDALGRIREGLVGANKTAQGKPLMMLWNLKGFEDVPADYDAQLETILKAYPARTEK